MANREKLQWLLSKLDFSTEKELETLLIEALTLNMAKRITRALSTLAQQREEVLQISQAEMVEKIGQMYRERGIKYAPPIQSTISRLEGGKFYPNLKPAEEKIWAEAYGVGFDEFSQMVDDLPFPGRKVA